MAARTVAVIGKLGVAWVAARATGLARRDAAMVGVLLNTRGVTELVVLSVGLQARLISPHVYTVFVLIALVTSAAGPILSAIRCAAAADRRELPVAGPGALMDGATGATARR